MNLQKQSITVLHCDESRHIGVPDRSLADMMNYVAQCFNDPNLSESSWPFSSTMVNQVEQMPLTSYVTSEDSVSTRTNQNLDINDGDADWQHFGVIRPAMTQEMREGSSFNDEMFDALHVATSTPDNLSVLTPCENIWDRTEKESMIDIFLCSEMPPSLSISPQSQSRTSSETDVLQQTQVAQCLRLFGTPKNMDLQGTHVKEANLTYGTGQQQIFTQKTATSDPWKSELGNYLESSSNDPLESTDNKLDSLLNATNLKTKQTRSKKRSNERTSGLLGIFDKHVEDSSLRHCLSERRRREKFNTHFEDLRSIVDTHLSAKASKASILGAAVDLVNKLRSQLEEATAKLAENEEPATLAETLQENFENGSLSRKDEKSDGMKLSLRLSDVFYDLQEELRDLSQGAQDYHLESAVPFIRVERAREANHMIISVMTQDRPGLFSGIMQALMQLDLRVLFVNTITDTIRSRNGLNVRTFLSKMEVKHSSIQSATRELIVATIASHIRCLSI